MGAYQSAKFAVEGFSEVLANEVKPFGVKVMIVEPGAFRTDWGVLDAAHEVGADYERTVGEINRYRAETSADWPGDPVRAAKVIVDVVDAAEPPLRLLLGATAVDLVRKSQDARAAEVQMWADVSRSADFPQA